MKEGFVESIPDTPIVHTKQIGVEERNWYYTTQLGGSKKFLTLVEGGSKSFGGMGRGVKKVWRQKFSIAQPPSKVFMNTP